MERKTKIIISIFIITFFSLSFFVGKVIHSRYFKKEIPQEINLKKDFNFQKESEGNFIQEDKEDLGDFLIPEDKEEDAQEEKELKEDLAEEKEMEKEAYIKIEKNDCENKCDNFRKKSEEFRYCQEVCGFIELGKYSSLEDCEDKEGLEEDYCLKDLAFSKKDYSICEKIEDKNISQSCHHRITEEIINGKN